MKIKKIEFINEDFSIILNNLDYEYPSKIIDGNGDSYIICSNDEELYAYSSDYYMIYKFPFEGKIISSIKENDYFLSFNEKNIFVNKIENKKDEKIINSQVIFHDNKCITSVEYLNKYIDESFESVLCTNPTGIITFDDNTKRIFAFDVSKEEFNSTEYFNELSLYEAFNNIKEEKSKKRQRIN